MKASELKQIIKEEIGKVLKEATNTFAAAALELVNIAEPMVKGGGYVDDMRPERRKSANIKTADQLSDFYYNIKEMLAGSADLKSNKMFMMKAKEIIVDKYKLSITDENGFPMKFK
jgi:hypothetical protein